MKTSPLASLLLGTFSFCILAIPGHAELVAYWNFDNAANTLEDSSGNGNDLTVGGDTDPEWGAATGFNDSGAYEFSADRLIAPIDVNPDQMEQMTMGAWVKTNSLDTGLRKILGSDNGGWDRTIGLDDRWRPGGGIPNQQADPYFRYTSFTGDADPLMDIDEIEANGDPVGDPGDLSSRPVSTDHWTFIAASYDEGTGTVTMYLDLDASTTDDPLYVLEETGHTFNPSLDTLAIGGLRSDNDAEAWDGAIDQVFVFNEVVSESALTGFRDSGGLPNGSGGLVSYWNFDDDTANDVVGENNAEKIVDAGFSADTPNGTGKSLDLTGDDYVKLPDTDFGVGATDSFTISMWVKHSFSERGVVSILHDLTSGGGDRAGVTFGISGDGSVFVGVIASAGDEDADLANGGATFRDITSDQVVPIDEWAHMAVTFGEDKLTTYLNGVAAGSYTANPADSIGDDGSDVTGGAGIDVTDGNGTFTGFGASGNAPEHGDTLGDFTRLFYDGLLDEVAIWDVALDAEAIVMLKDGTAPQDVPLPAPPDNDLDDDGLPNSFEEMFAFLDPNDAADAAADQDGDNLTNLQEFELGTAPDDEDTDGDGINDGDEVAANTDPTDPRSPAPPGSGSLVAYYTLDGNFEDSTGNGNDGTFFGGVTFTRTIPENLGSGMAAEFDGQAGTFGSINHEEGGLAITKSPAHSVSMWVKGVGTDNSDDRVFSEGMTFDNGPLFNVGTKNDGTNAKVDFFFRNGGGTGHLFSSADAFDGDWHHLAWVDTGGLVDLYIDGVFDTQFDYSEFSNDSFAPDTTTIGGILRATDCCNFLGSIDDVAMWNGVLSTDEISSLAGGTSPLELRGTGGLISYYDFDDDTANDVVGDNDAEKIVDAGFSADTPSGSGKSLDLTGDDYVKLPDTDFGIGEESTFTIATWMKMTSSERGAISILHDLTGGGGDRSGVTLGASADGSAFVGIIASTGDEFGDEANAGGTFRDITADLTVPTGEWAHLAATLDGDDRLTVYVNGEPAQSYAVNPAASIDEDGGDVTGGLGIDFIDTGGSFTGFGASGNSPEDGSSLGDFTRLFYDGLLDDVAIWNTALDASVIKLLAAGILPTQLNLGDADGDGLPDSYEEQFAFLDPANAADAAADQDEDGLSNLDEFKNNTAPDKKDTDEDGLDDNIETGTGNFVDGNDTGTNATNPDTDDDGLLDGVETNTGIWVSADNTGTDPHNPDTDEDGLGDGIETNTGILVGVDNTGTDPHKADTDGDEFSDLEELAKGSDPFDAESVPPAGPEGGLVSYWNFDDGTTVTDQVGTNNGTVIEGADFSDSVPDSIGTGKSLDLSGEKAYVRIGLPSPDSPTFGIDETSSFTISMWVNYEASERGIVTIKQDLTSGGGDRAGLTLGIGGDGRAFVGIIASTGDEEGDVANSGPTFRDITTDQDIPTGEWVHMAATLIDDALVVYVNGEPAEDYSVTPGGAIEPDGTNISEGLGIDFIDTDGSFTGFGASGNGPEHGDSNGDFTRLFYDGLLDDVAIWNIGISADDVQRLAAGESPLEISKIVPFRITDVQLDANRSVTLTWNSKSNGLYTLAESDDLIVWLEVDDGIDSQGETTQFTLEGVPADVRSRYYRIIEQ